MMKIQILQFGSAALYGTAGFCIFLMLLNRTLILMPDSKRKAPIILMAFALIAGGVAIAGDHVKTPVQLLDELKTECAQPKSPDAAVWTSYLSETERIRWRIMGDLAKHKEIALPLIKTEMREADGDYQQMLTCCLAALGDADGIAETTNILLNAKAPAVRVCAAKALRDAKEKKAIPALQAAMRDPYTRADGSCVKIGDGKCHPVRIVAGDALATLGFTIEQINSMEKEVAQSAPREQ